MVGQGGGEERQSVEEERERERDGVQDKSCPGLFAPRHGLIDSFVYIASRV